MQYAVHVVESLQLPVDHVVLQCDLIIVIDDNPDEYDACIYHKLIVSLHDINDLVDFTTVVDTVYVLYSLTVPAIPNIDFALYFGYVGMDNWIKYMLKWINWLDK